MPKCFSKWPVRRVSSAATKSHSLSVRTARKVMSSKFPIGVATRYKVPGWSAGRFPFIAPRLLADPAVAAAHKFHEVQEFRAHRELPLDPRERIGNGQPFAKQKFERLAQGRLGFLRQSVPLHPDLVHRSCFSRISVHDHKRGHVLHDLGAATDHGHFANPAELMNCRQTADDGI